MTAWALLQRAIALSGLVIISPVLATLAIAVRATSPGPVLYRARRVGRGGVPITVHKFRSMAASDRHDGLPLTPPSDDRVTRIGRVMRARRLDELPQLWDVVRGRMALVGPRPEDPMFVDVDDPSWQEVLSVLPGITGSTQLIYRNESRAFGEDPVETYRAVILPAKLALDMEYVRTRSVRGDVAIVVATLRMVLGRA